MKATAFTVWVWLSLVSIAFASAALAAVAIIATLPPELREPVRAALPADPVLLVISGIFMLALLGIVSAALVRQFIVPALRMTADVRLIALTNPAHRVNDIPHGPLGALAAEVNRLATHRADLTSQLDERIRSANHDIAQERDRLAALLSEIDLCVVCCNNEGIVLAYNRRAQFLMQSPDSALALGRSIFGFIDRHVIAHGMDTLRRLPEHESRRPTACFSATLLSGRLVRIQMTPVLHQAHGNGESPEIAGYVLVLQDIDAEAREKWGLHSALLRLRSALQVATTPSVASGAEALDAMRDTLEQALSMLARKPSTELAIHAIPATAFADALATELSSADIEMDRRLPDTDVWLEIDAYWMKGALSRLAQALCATTGLRVCRLDVEVSANRLALTLSAEGSDAETSPVASALEAALSSPFAESMPSVNDVFAAHHTHPSVSRNGSRVSVGFAVAEAEHGHHATPPDVAPARPGYFDFDLFAKSLHDTEFERRSLMELRYSVFDTETTGLNPAGGDEIISIGAVHVVNGRVIGHETFDQLIDPGRSLPGASVRIHGITDEMVRGNPRIPDVLPGFHAFCAGTVLVAHNAAFDMRFLELKEAGTGVRFRQPVLDTLLLSAVVHPDVGSHSLEAIAQRFGIDIVGRHTALGDAMVTAEVFIRLVTLLTDRGVRTLGDALEASRKTPYARIRY
jgi:DNA polymerase-3 subunit epsilon